MNTQIKLKRGSAANLTAVNPVLSAGEPAYEIDTGKFKIGNGTTAWNSLPYAVTVDGGEIDTGLVYFSTQNNAVLTATVSGTERALVPAT
jgi:hypothetical protein